MVFSEEKTYGCLKSNFLIAIISKSTQYPPFSYNNLYLNKSANGR